MPRLKNKIKPTGSMAGRPRTVIAPVDPEALDPASVPSLQAYFKKQGKLTETNTAQLYKARHLYVTRCVPPSEISKSCGIPFALVERWVIIFDWEERRDKLLYKRYKTIQGLDQATRSKNMDERHDRIATTLEGTIETVLHKSSDPDDEFELQPKDIVQLARALKDMQGVRRVVHNKPTQKVDVQKKITLDTEGSFNNMRDAIGGLFGAAGDKNSLMEDQESKHLKVMAEVISNSAQDAEFEDVEDEASESN